MARYSTPPPELQRAIDAAARANPPVTPAMLTGIWRIESGSSFPNPYVNSSGYGGLFGTTLWNGSTQAQANLAASILARLIRDHNGDLAAALSAYSGGGYSSLPGVASTAPTPSSTSTATRPRPSSSSSSSSAPTSQYAGFQIFPGVDVTPFEKAWEGLFGANPITAAADLLKAFVWLANPRSWLRLVEFGTGALLIVLSLVGLAVGLLSKSPAGRAGLGLLGLEGLLVGRRRGRRRATRRRRSSNVDELAARRARTEEERAKEVRARRRERLERARDLRREREKRERAAYFRGAADASK